MDEEEKRLVREEAERDWASLKQEMNKRKIDRVKEQTKAILRNEPRGNEQRALARRMASGDYELCDCGMLIELTEECYNPIHDEEHTDK